MENDHTSQLLQALKSSQNDAVTGALYSIRGTPTGNEAIRTQLTVMLTDRRLCIFQLERPTLVAEVCYAAGEALACERARVGIEEDVTVNQTFKPIDATQVYNVLAVSNNSSHFYQIAQELLEELEAQGTVERSNFIFPIRMYHYRIWRQNATPAERLRKSGYSLSVQQSLPEVSERSEQLQQIEQVYAQLKQKKSNEDLNSREEVRLAYAEIALVAHGKLHFVENILDDFLIPHANDKQAQASLPGKTMHITSCNAALAELLPLPDDCLNIGYSVRFLKISPQELKQWFLENAGSLVFDEVKGKYVFG